MYIWVVLATFLAILYSYNLALRGDERKIQVEPLAQAAVSKFVIQHRMGQQYVRDRTPKKVNSPYGTDGDTITYDKGQKDCDDELKDYKPVGYICDNNYTTEIYCSDKNNWSQEANDCKSNQSSRFLITYGPIPQRWVNLSSDTPTNDFLNALQTIIGIDTSIGYAIKSDASGYEMEIKGREDNALYLPNLVVNSGGFKSRCACTNCRRCLVYLSTYGESRDVDYGTSGGEEN